jgi:hypothetical protein
MKNPIKLALLLFAVVVGFGFTPGFVAFFRIDVDGDPKLAAKALEEAVVNSGGKLYQWDSPRRWFNVPFSADGSGYSPGNSFNVGFEVKGARLVVVSVNGAIAGGCSPSRSKAAELQAEARLKGIVEKASKAVGFKMSFSEARNANGDP